MDNLIIKKSDTENITIPLTTEKPVARSLAVFKDGQIHYAPLVHSGDYLDSGVKVHIDSMNYSLASELYDPLTRDSAGTNWIATGPVGITNSGEVIFGGYAGFASASTVYLDSTADIYFRCRFTPTIIAANHSVPIFSFVSTAASKRFGWNFWYARKNVFSINGSAVLTGSTALTLGDTHDIEFHYQNGTVTLILDGFSDGTVTGKNIPSADYTIYLGLHATDITRCFRGALSNIYYDINGTAAYFSGSY